MRDNSLDERKRWLRRLRVGLALSGGAARSIAHVGVLQVFEKHGVPVDMIAGTSAGAIVGGAVAAGVPLAEVEALARRLRWRDVGRVTLERLGVQSNAALEAMLRKLLPVTRFEDLDVPFAAVAADLQNGAAVVLRDTGDVPFAIRASCAVPGWYTPVTDAQGRKLVDGGIVLNVPAGPVRALGADIVIAVDVNSEGAKFLSGPRSAFGVLLQSLVIMQQASAARQWHDADYVIKPCVGHLRWDELARADEFIRAGMEAAESSIGDIKNLIAVYAQKGPQFASALK